MKPFFSFCGYTRSVSTVALPGCLLLAALALTGCAGTANLPDTVVSTPSTTANPIQGSVFGGHAPIVGAHVYILQAGTGGYAAAATNLMTSGSAGSDAHGNYVLTDANGAFNVTGDYACTTGQPVYLAATGGMTSTSIGGSNYSTAPITISSATSTYISIINSYVLTFTGNNLLYPGQSVVFSGLTGGWSGLNGGVTTVTAATTTSFSILYAAGISGTTTGTAQPQSAINPAIANLAVLGNCPSTGNFSTSGPGSDVISYVYMNEVSTAAAAYAFAGFGSGPFNIGYPSSSSLAKTGIQNAANNAAQLYDIQGKYISTTFAGEGHIANPTTPNGNGVVPQATLDTLGNIVASCVDSANLSNSASNPNVSGASSSCSKLFGTATSNGIPYGNSGAGTSPTDTATAAFNIAHYPAGNPAYTSSFTGGLFILQGAQETPFSPNLASAPNDFTIGIQYNETLNPAVGSAPYSIVDQPDAVAVDAAGNFWFTTEPSNPALPGRPVYNTPGYGYFAEYSPTGVNLHNFYNRSWVFGDVAIDSSGNAWSGNQQAYVDATEYGPTTSYIATSRGSAFTYAQAAVADNSASSGNVFFPHGPTNPPPAANDNNQTLSEITPSNSTSQVTALALSFGPGAYATHGAIDSASAIWFTSDTVSLSVSAYANGNVITRVGSITALPALGFPINSSTNTLGCPSSVASIISSPEQPAIDAAGNAWVPIYNSGSGSSVIKVTPAAACTSYTVGNGPYGATIDGAGNLWVTNSAGNSLSELSTTTGTALSPATNYTVGGLLSGPLGLSVDLSGDLIVTNFTGNSIVEVIGAAAPTYLPLGVAAANGKLGAKP